MVKPRRRGDPCGAAEGGDASPARTNSSDASVMQAPPRGAAQGGGAAAAPTNDLPPTAALRQAAAAPGAPAATYAPRPRRAAARKSTEQSALQPAVGACHKVRAQ